VTPEQVPDELVAAAQQADIDWMRKVLREVGGSWQAVPDEQVRRLLAAVLPVHERQVREQVSTQILQSVCAPGEQCADRFCRDCTRYEQAQRDARLARGES
jgi:hypothetical protein